MDVVAYQGNTVKVQWKSAIFYFCDVCRLTVCIDMPLVRLAPCPSIFSRSLSLPGSVFPFARVCWHVSFFFFFDTCTSEYRDLCTRARVFSHRSLFGESNSRRRLGALSSSHDDRPKNRPNRGTGKREGKGRARLRMFAVKIDSPGRKRKGGRSRKLPEIPPEIHVAPTRLSGRPRSTTSDFSCPPREANRPEKGGEKHWLGFVDVANRASSCALHTTYQRWTDGEKRARGCIYVYGEGKGV